MTLTKLKAKNQVTIPSVVIKRLGLKKDGFFAVDVYNNGIYLTPVKIEPVLSPKELEKISKVVKKEKQKGKAFSPGKEFSAYLNKIA